MSSPFRRAIQTGPENKCYKTKKKQIRFASRDCNNASLLPRSSCLPFLFRRINPFFFLQWTIGECKELQRHEGVCKGTRDSLMWWKPVKYVWPFMVPTVPYRVAMLRLVYYDVCICFVVVAIVFTTIKWLLFLRLNTSSLGLIIILR